MLFSVGAGFILPYEVFLFSYAILGPAHYLTQISWMHDRQYFTTGKYDWILLCAAVILAFAASSTDRDIAFFTLIGLGSAVGMVFFKTIQKKVLLVFGLFLTAFLASRFSGVEIFLSVLLPTVIHVFIFTGAFILLGALRSRSLSGLVSFAVFLGCAIFPFVFRWGADQYEISPFGLDATAPFNKLQSFLVSFLDLNQSKQASVIVMRFIAFAYTYHYLNWFSKTKVIGWNDISRDRLVLIVILYFCFIGLYLKSYILGYTAVLFLSVLHVFLEFPLNIRSFVDIGKTLRTIQSSGWTR